MCFRHRYVGKKELSLLFGWAVFSSNASLRHPAICPLILSCVISSLYASYVGNKIFIGVLKSSRTKKCIAMAMANGWLQMPHYGTQFCELLATEILNTCVHVWCVAIGYFSDGFILWPFSCKYTTYKHKADSLHIRCAPALPLCSADELFMLHISDKKKSQTQKKSRQYAVWCRRDKTYTHVGARTFRQVSQRCRYQTVHRDDELEADTESIHQRKLYSSITCLKSNEGWRGK